MFIEVRVPPQASLFQCLLLLLPLLMASSAFALLLSATSGYQWCYTQSPHLKLRASTSMFS